MADYLDDVTDTYVPPVPVIPETQRRCSLCSLGLPEDNFNIVTSGDDFDADNNTTGKISCSLVLKLKVFISKYLQEHYTYTVYHESSPLF